MQIIAHHGLEQQGCTICSLWGIKLIMTRSESGASKNNAHGTTQWVSIPWNILSHCLEHFLPRLFLRKTLHRIEDFILLNGVVSLYLFRQFKHKFTKVMNHILGTFPSAKYRILNLGCSNNTWFNILFPLKLGSLLTPAEIPQIKCLKSTLMSTNTRGNWF